MKHTGPPFEKALPPSTVEEVRCLYLPAVDYRISPCTHPAGTRFEGAGKAGRVHVLAGACEFKFKGSLVALSAGQGASLPAGDYSFAVLGPDAVQLVLVWHLPTVLAQSL